MVFTPRPLTVPPDRRPPYPDDRPLIAELLDPTLTRAEADAHLAVPSTLQQRRPGRPLPRGSVRRYEVCQCRPGQ
jgi:hypothetical protein